MDLNLLSTLLSNGGAPAPAPGGMLPPPPIPAPAPVNPLAALGLSIPGQPGQEASDNLDRMETTKELKDRILKESPANAILMGMLQNGDTPEKMTGGQIARNALANFARGIMMGSNFKSIEDEQRERKQQAFQTKLATVKAAVSEDNAQKMQARQLLTQIQGEKWKQEAATVKQQHEQLLREKQDQQAKIAEGRQRVADAGLELKKFDLATKAGRTEALNKLTEKKLLTPENQFEFFTHLQELPPEKRKGVLDLVGEYEEQLKKSKFEPRAPQDSLRPLSGFDAPDGTMAVVDKTGQVSVVPLPDGVGKQATMTTRTGAERAKSVEWLASEMLASLDENEKALGAPLKSRWEEFKTGKVGLPNRGYTELRDYAKLLQTKLMQVHTGNRASDTMLHHFAGMIDTGVQDPVNLRATIGVIKKYTDAIAIEAKPSTRGATPAAGAEDWVRGPDGKLRKR